jgi:hypothetical protein
VKLHSPAFEKRLRRAVKETVQRSPALKGEFKRAKKPRHYNGWRIARPTISLGFGLVIGSVFRSSHEVVAGLAAISIWGFAAVVFQAQSLSRTLYRASDLPVLLVLPVKEDVIFRWELQKFLRASVFVLLDFLAGFAALGWELEFSAARWVAAVLVGLAAWAMVVALAAAGLARVPRLPYGLFSFGFIATGFALFIGRKFIGDAVVAFLARHGAVLNLALPTGWVVSQFELLAPGPRWSTLGLLVPMTGVLLLGKSSLQRLRRNYVFKEVTVPAAPDLVPDVGGAGEAARSSTSAEAFRVGATAIEEIIRSRQFLQAPSWPDRGWFERRLWRWFSRREKALAEFVFPAGLAIWGPWQKIFRNLAIGYSAAVVLAFVFPGGRKTAVCVALFVTFCQVLGSMFGVGRGFRPIFSSGINIPLYAGYPIGYGELGQLLCKYSAIQLPLLLVFGVAFSLGIVYLTGVPIAVGIALGLKGSWILFSARLLLLVFAFSSGTNDTAGLGPRKLMVILLAVVACLTFLGLAAAGVFVPDPTLSALMCALTTADAYLFFKAYGWCYNRMMFDLMAAPRQ